MVLEIDIKKMLSELNLTEEQYEACLKDLSDCKESISDLDWIDIKNKYSLPFHKDTLRKSSQTPFGGATVAEYYKNKGFSTANQEWQDEIQVQKRELEREKIKFRDERNAWQKQNYIQARVEQKLDTLECELSKIGNVNFALHNNPQINSNNDLLIMLSDLHIGQTFKSMFGEYNTGIAKDRLNQYLNEIIGIQKLYNSEKCYISLQGDLISGNIHKSIQVSNRENVIEQIKIASELISSFCYELSKYFSVVFMQDVSGNHTRIDEKKDAIHDDRLDDLIAWSVENSLKHIENFHVLKRKLDIGISDFDIRGKFYIGTHGDFDSMSNSGIARLCMMLGFMPYAIISGHKHFPAYTEFNGVKMVQGGSLAGGGCDYTIEKRLSGKPSQTVIVCTDKGIKAIHNIELN